VTEHDVRRALMRVNTRKAPGNGISPQYSTYPLLSLDPSCFKWSTIVPVPKTASPACLNDYQPVALTSVVMKCFERLIKDYICDFLPPSMDPQTILLHR